jgi:hypothetical protein
MTTARRRYVTTSHVIHSLVNYEHIWNQTPPCSATHKPQRRGATKTAICDVKFNAVTENIARTQRLCLSWDIPLCIINNKTAATGNIWCVVLGSSLTLSIVDVARGTVKSGTYKPLNNDQRKNADKPYAGIRSSGREKLQKGRTELGEIPGVVVWSMTRACSINRTSQLPR